MKSITAIVFIVCVVATSIQGLKSNLKEERLVSQSERTIEGYIETLSTEIANFKTNFFLQLSALGVHTDLIKEKLEGTALHLDTLSLLEGAYHVCVQNQRSNIPAIDSVKNRISECVTSALQHLNLYIEPAEQLIENLKNYLRKQLKTDLNGCEDDNSGESRFDCIVRTIRDSNGVTIRIRKDFTRAMHAAEFQSEHRIKQALDCGFHGLYEVILKVGETQSSLRHCIDKSQEEPCNFLTYEQQQRHGLVELINRRSPTVQTESNITATGLCENVLNLSRKKLNVNNSTIQIPTHAIQNNTSCLRINFIEEPKAQLTQSTSITR